MRDLVSYALGLGVTLCGALEADSVEVVAFGLALLGIPTVRVLTQTDPPEPPRLTHDPGLVLPPNLTDEDRAWVHSMLQQNF